MNPQFNNPFEQFVRQRKSTCTSPGQEGLSAASIDDMLDALDRVLNDNVTINNIDAVEPAPILETIQVILDEVADAFDRLESVAGVDQNEDVMGFVEETRPKLERLKRKLSSMPQSGMSPMEFELDYEALHDFMLSPDVSRLAS